MPGNPAPVQIMAGPTANQSAANPVIPNCPDSAQHPGTDYFVNKATGTIQRAGGGFLGIGRLAAPFDAAGPFNWCEAKAYANNATGSGFLHGSAEANIAKNAASSVFGAATQPAMWVRVGEVLLGLALVIVGLAKLAEGTPIGDAAKKAAKAAMLT